VNLHSTYTRALTFENMTGRNTVEALQETPAPVLDPDNPFSELFVVRGTHRGALPPPPPQHTREHYSL
jgi:hypothetical protein